GDSDTDHYPQRAQRTQKQKSDYLPQRRQGAKVTGRGPSSRANARDLRKISPFGRNDKESFFPNLASLRLGGRNVRIRAFLAPGKFAHAAQIITDSSAKFANGNSDMGRVCNPPSSIALPVLL